MHTIQADPQVSSGSMEAVYRVMLSKFLASLAPDGKEGDQSITGMITRTILSIWSQPHEFNSELAGMKTSFKGFQ